MEGTRRRKSFQRMGKRIKRQMIIKQIPQDIIEDISFNLPIKSLLRFKCVSKEWRSLISGKHFTKEHLKRSSDSILRHNLIYSFYDNDRAGHILRSCSLKSFHDKQNYENHPMVTTSYHDPFGAKPVQLKAMVGSCNGLILMASMINFHCSDLILWNPSTRRVKIIPPPTYARRKRYRTNDHFVYGFGYDDSTDDYKVVSIFASKAGPYKTRMYSLRTNSWKKIGDFEKGLQGRRCSSVHVNGKLHYWLEAQGGGGEIVSLSLVDGKYDIVPLPPDYDHRSHYVLDNLGGYLSLVRNSVSYGSVYFWIMRKYGEAESWTNRFIDLNLSDPMRATNGPRPRPIWLTKKGEVIVAINGSKFVVSNRKNKSQVYEVDTEIRLHIVGYDMYNIYVESFVSP